MNGIPRDLARLLMASAAFMAFQTAHAQTAPASGYRSTTDGATNAPLNYEAPAAGPRAHRDASYSWLPYTTRGYIGVSGGQAKYDLPCPTGFSCDDSNKAFKIYTGGMLNQNFGVELGYLQGGNADRAGGEVKARGVNISLIGLLPFNETFEAFGKVGGTYGWTKTSASALSGVATGDEEGGGVSYGVGLNVFFTPNWGAVVEWERHRFHFAGDSKENLDLATVGLKYRF